MTDEEAKEQWRHGMASVLGELEELYARDQIGAVSISIAYRDGNVRHLKCYDDGFRILLIAAAAIGLKEATELPMARDPGDWFIPGQPKPEEGSH